jgi:hypothetical protein
MKVAVAMTEANAIADEARMRAAGVVARFRNDLLNDSGLISRVNPPDPRTIFDNFDDVAPFMLWWGASDLMLEQVDRLDTGSFERELPLGNLLHAYKIDEYVGGLNAVTVATGSDHARRLRDDAVAKCWSYFADPNVGFSEFYDFDSKTRSPFFSPWAAGLLECMLELDTCDDVLAGRIDAILDRWWSHPYAEATGMLPFRGAFAPWRERSERLWAHFGVWRDEPPIRWAGAGGSLRGALRRSHIVSRSRQAFWAWGGSGRWSQLMKSNTTPVFLALALYARNGDPKWRRRVMRWFEAVAGTLVDAGGVRGAARNGQAMGEPTLVDGFILIDAACEAWRVLGRDGGLLALAAKAAGATLGWQWENGLLPMTPTADRDHLDGQIDFAIALRRLGELSGDERLLERSVALLRSAFAAHETPGGYCTHVRRDGGVVTLPHNTVDPKYNALALKGLISLATMDRTIYGSADLPDLFKDR